MSGLHETGGHPDATVGATAVSQKWPLHASAPVASDLADPIILNAPGQDDDTDGELLKERACHTSATVLIYPQTRECTAVEVADAIPTNSVSSMSVGDEDPNFVEWHHEDPSHPQHWKNSRKWIAVVIGECY